MPFARRLSRHHSLGARVAALAAALLLLVAVAAPAYGVSGPTGLFDATVSPATGTPDTSITIQVSYRNHEGSEAAYVDVVIDGGAHAMAGGGSDWKNGVRFTYVTQLPVGSHTVSFKAADTRKFESFLDGPSIVISVPDPTPTPTPVPTATPKPTPTATPVPTATPKPTPTPTPAPTATPRPTPTPGPTPTPRPTPGPTGTPAPTPGATPTAPAATGTPVPTAATSSSPSPAPSSSVTALVVPPGGADGGTIDGGGPGAPTDGGGPVDGAPGAWRGGDPGTYGPGGPDYPPDAWLPGTAAGGGSQSDGSAGGGPGEGPSTPGLPAGEASGPGADDLRSLGLGTPPLPLGARMAVQVVATGSCVTLAMAFLMFGKRRRDGEPPAPDDVLHGAASTPMLVPAASVVPAFAPAPAPGLPGGLSPDELAMPRWRRPSLMAARKADPLRDSVDHASLTFDHGAVAPVEGYERRVLRYRLVRLLDQPDELRGTEIGFLDQGDEVQLVQRSGAYWLVLCPDGSRGWIHKMTLGDVVAPREEPTGADGRRRMLGATSIAAAASAASAGSSAGPSGLEATPGLGRAAAFGAGRAFSAATGSGAPLAADAEAPGDAGMDDLSGVDDDVVLAFLSARRAG